MTITKKIITYTILLNTIRSLLRCAIMNKSDDKVYDKFLNRLYNDISMHEDPTNYRRHYRYYNKCQ